MLPTFSIPVVSQDNVSAKPGTIPEPPESMIDVLSQILESISLRSRVSGRSELSSPWGFRFPASFEEIPPRFRPPPPPGPELLRRHGPPRTPPGQFHIITRGRCVVEVDGVSEPAMLEAGDMVVLVHGNGHQLRDSLRSPVKPLWEIQPFERFRQGLGISINGGGAMTTIISGALFFEHRQHNRLLAALPPLIPVQAKAGHAIPWLDDAIRFISHEATQRQPGYAMAINHLAHVLFIQAVRVHLASLPRHGDNWLRALLDPEIGPALGFIHKHPEAPWTVAELADAVAMSRSAFAARFTSLVSQPPLQYLTNVRMQRAADLLKDPDIPIKEVAAKAGYDSEAAFSHAFKRFHGTSPNGFRKANPRMSSPAT